MLTHNHAVPSSGANAAYRRLDNSNPASTTMERSIDSAANNGGYLWQQKLAVKRLASHIPQQPGLVLGTARSIYMALTEVASDQRTPTRACAANAHLAKLSGYSADTVHRYIREFEQMGIVTVLPGRGQYDPNTYLLLLLPLPNQISGLDAETLPLADGAGKSRGGTGARSAPPSSDGRGGSDARSEPLRGGTPATQIQNERLRTKRTNKQTGVVEPPVVDPAGLLEQQVAERSAPAAIGIQIPQLVTTLTGDQQATAGIQIPKPATTLTGDQQATAQQLTAIGVQRRVAEELAFTCKAETVKGWIAYTHTAKGITSPAGFVLAKLRAGDEPPRPCQPAAQDWVAEYAAEQRRRQEEEARTLLARYGVDQPTLELWLTVCHQLQAEHDEAYYLCFKDAFLACPDAHTALLVLPPRVPLEQAASYAPLLRELLAAHIGTALRLRFEHVRPGDEPINFAAADGEQPAIIQRTAPEPATSWMQSVWLAAADDLQHLVGDEVWHSWLQQVRLVGCDGDTWVLRVPASNVSRVQAERWSVRMVATLSAIYGRAVSLRFTTRG